MHKIPIQRDFDLNQRDRFVHLSQRMIELVAREGLSLRAFDSLTLPHFTAANFDERKRVIELLELTNRLIEKVHSEGLKASDSTSLVWAFFSSSKYIPTSETFDKIEDGDMVDIYNLQGQLIFANLRFYEVSSYTLEQLYFCHWHILYCRDTEIHQTLKNIWKQIATEPHQLYDLRHVGAHQAKENFGSITCVFQPTYFSSLVHQGKVAAICCINRIVDVQRE